jgi:anoctamin-10
MGSQPDVDLVLVFQSSYPSLHKKDKLLYESKEAQEEYNKLLQVLRSNGFRATGRRGGSQGEILILIYAPHSTMEKLAQAERHSDFLLGLPSSGGPSYSRDLKAQPLTPSERLRLIHSYISATTVEGGLGLVPGAHDYPRLHCMVALHDLEFDNQWIHDLTQKQIGFGVRYEELIKIKDQVRSPHSRHPLPLTPNSTERV